MSAALPPGLGLERSLPRQLSSACTRTRIGAAAGAPISGLDDHRDVRMAEDLLRVRDDHGADATLLVAHVGAREQGVAAGAFDHAGYYLARFAGLHVGHERDALHREPRLRHADHLEPRVMVLVRV